MDGIFFNQNHPGSLGITHGFFPRWVPGNNAVCKVLACAPLGHQCMPRGFYPDLWWFRVVGGIPTPLKNDGVRQLGWWHSQYDGKNKNHVPNHQPDSLCLWTIKNGDLTKMVISSWLPSFRRIGWREHLNRKSGLLPWNGKGVPGYFFHHQILGQRERVKTHEELCLFGWSGYTYSII